jgi:TRAP-type C4-dicarboxylate transport system permease small subunit
VSDDKVPVPSTGPEGWAAASLLLGVFMVILLQIFSRYLPLPIPIWTEELSRWLWVWLVFVGVAEVERSDAHLKMDLVAGALPPRLRTILYLTIDVVSLLVFAELLRIGYNGALRTVNAASVTLPVPMAVFYAACPVGAVFIVIRVVQRSVARIRSLARPTGRAAR